MQSVIGTYASFLEAQHAVRSLERTRFSLQDIVIADRRHGSGRGQMSSAHVERRAEGQSNFLVIMTGDQANITRATELLREGRGA